MDRFFFTQRIYIIQKTGFKILLETISCYLYSSILTTTTSTLQENMKEKGRQNKRDFERTHTHTHRVFDSLHKLWANISWNFYLPSKEARDRRSRVKYGGMRNWYLRAMDKILPRTCIKKLYEELASTKYKAATEYSVTRVHMEMNIVWHPSTKETIKSNAA